MSDSALSVRGSNIHGRGVFTERPVRRGEYVAFVHGRTTTVERPLLYTPEEATMNPNWLGVTPTSWIVPDEPYVFINHSCDPTCGIRGIGELHALRDLAAGDEITIDYSVSEANPYWRMDCACGSPRCQKRLRSIAWLPRETYERYYPFIPDALADFWRRHCRTAPRKAPRREQEVVAWLLGDLAACKPVAPEAVPAA